MDSDAQQQDKFRYFLNLIHTNNTDLTKVGSQFVIEKQNLFNS